MIFKKSFCALLFFTFFFCFLSPKSAFADTFTLSGSVKDSAGNAISGSTVSVNDANSDSTTTDISGNYILSIPEGTYNVHVTPPSGSNFSSALAVNQNIHANTVLNFVLVPTGTVTLGGKVLDRDNQPLANQTVSIAPSGTSNFTSSVSDANGNYSFSVSPGNYKISISGSNPLTVNAPPTYSIQSSGTLGLTQSIIMDIPLPAKQVILHVQDANGVVQPNIGISTTGPSLPNIPIGTVTNATGTSSYGSSLGLTTDTNGDATLWLFQTPSSGNRYTITATPPSGSIFDTFSLTNVAVTADQTELISLQYNHATPLTTASLATQNSDETYSNPTTITLSAAATSGYTISNTYYTIDGGSQQTYTAPFAVSGNGNHTITYWSVDNSGVPEAPNSKPFTISARYTLTGTVYNDANQNGFQDTGEEGYDGATVSLDSGQTTTTNANGNYTFSNLPTGTYVETLTVPNGYIATTTNPANISLAANTTQNFGVAQENTNTLITALNAGGNSSGDFFSDANYSGGSQYSSSAAVDTSEVNNPAPQAVYQTVRYGNFTYTIPNLTPNANYTVRLHFNELYWGTNGNDATGDRVFNVSLNGTQVLSNYDIYAKAGVANKAVIEQLPTTADSNGNIAIQFSTVVDNAMVNGIEVYSGTLPSPTPTATPTPASSARINAGGSTSGNFASDKNYVGGQPYTSSASVDTTSVTNPAPQNVYQSVRYGNFTYTIPNLTPSTNYLVRLHFNELYWNSAGSRVFNVKINGTTVLTNYDIYQAAGGANKAIVEDFTKSTDANGKMAIQFITITDNAMVNGIELIQQ